jgi:hypothetical protein
MSHPFARTWMIEWKWIFFLALAASCFDWFLLTCVLWPSWVSVLMERRASVWPEECCKLDYYARWRRLIEALWSCARVEKRNWFRSSFATSIPGSCLQSRFHGLQWSSVELCFDQSRTQEKYKKTKEWVFLDLWGASFANSGRIALLIFSAFLFFVYESHWRCSRATTYEVFGTFFVLCSKYLLQCREMNRERRGTWAF